VNGVIDVGFWEILGYFLLFALGFGVCIAILFLFGLKASDVIAFTKGIIDFLLPKIIDVFNGVLQLIFHSKMSS